VLLLSVLFSACTGISLADVFWVLMVVRRLLVNIRCKVLLLSVLSKACSVVSSADSGCVLLVVRRLWLGEVVCCYLYL